MTDGYFEVEKPIKTPPMIVKQSKQRWECLVVLREYSFVSMDIKSVFINGVRLDKKEWKEKWMDKTIHLGLNELAMKGWRITGTRQQGSTADFIFMERLIGTD